MNILSFALFNISLAYYGNITQKHDISSYNITK